MKQQCARVGAHVLIGAVLFAPAFVLVIVANRNDIDTSTTLATRFTEYRSDLSQGRITESFIMAVCVVIMFVAWLRIVWVAGIVVVSQWRGHEQSMTNHPVARIVLRVLLLAPVTMNVSTQRVAALPTSVTVDSAATVESSAATKEILLVSIAVAVGVSWRLRRRRLAALREDATTDADVDGLSFESDVARHGDDVALSRLELAVRSLISSGECDFRWLIQHDSGLIHVECSPSHRHDAPWTKVSDRIWVLDAGTSLADLGRVSGRADVRIPMLIPVGVTDAGNVWVNLESTGSFSVTGHDHAADEVWDGLCQSLALSPLHISVTLVSAREHALQGRRQLLTEDTIQAENIAAVLRNDESPSVVLIADRDKRTMYVSGAQSAINDPRRQESGECGLTQRGGKWYLMPMQSPIQPTMCRLEDRQTITHLIGSTLDVVVCSPRTEHIAIDDASRHPLIGEILAGTSFIVRVMGRPGVEHVEDSHRREVVFERSRSEELVVWLALHPDRRRRSAARSEMWNVPVKDATFSNVTSDVRRSMTAHQLPPTGDQWLSVTLTDDMPLHPRIVTDVSILETCVDHARRRPEDGGADVLAFGLSFVRGCPLEGSRYLWRDTTGISTGIAMLIVRAAMLCAEMALERGDVDMVYWSTAKGLSAVPGHEGLVSLRMRQHADNGDRASLSAEWESYCRSLMNDDWGDAQPSQRMVDLWFSLSGIDPHS